MVDASNYTGETGARGSRARGQRGLCSETLEREVAEVPIEVVQKLRMKIKGCGAPLSIKSLEGDEVTVNIKGIMISDITKAG